MYCFNSFNIITNYKGSLNRILKIIFGKDGSIYTIFPGFLYQEGIVACVSMKAGITSSNINLAEYGRIASCLVKYSHHPDGRVHFSQKGRVKTEIKKQSTALNIQNEHVFTLYVYGMNSFPTAKKQLPNSLTINLEENITGFKIIVHRYNKENILSGRQLNEPIIQFPDGTRKKGFAVTPTSKIPYHNYFLFITEEKWNIKRDKPLLLFLGGFDSRKVSGNIFKDTSFLVCMYPCDNADILRNTIGSIDLPVTETM